MYNATRGFWIVLMLAAPLSACGTDAEADTNTDADQLCTSSTLRYDNFGSAFMEDYCLSCHSSAAATRRGAPAAINFDTHDEVKERALRIMARSATGDSMPPASAQAAPSSAERALLAEWIECGVR